MEIMDTMAVDMAMDNLVATQDMLAILLDMVSVQQFGLFYLSYLLLLLVLAGALVATDTTTINQKNKPFYEVYFSLIANLAIWIASSKVSLAHKNKLK